ncbi:phage tail protein I [Glaciimonas sp. Gout2]|uniref:phage tail protein I n=1 Tax=unclassified Glaciimonas TaxID=2644401 RepID=UPI002B236A67|nr:MULTISPECIES: phage tail protein I [unclassified Glaciimonas]MEB0012575.1 phage tail protein I [Glaciimonas sp. Cout2]MEB0083926.1 phage tail protein I [Glaciimonas sp. Gout2]
MNKPVPSSYRSLLPPNTTPQERALEAATARISAVPVPLRSLYQPYACPINLLPWLAWQLSIDSWKPYWSEEVRRARVRSAMAIHRQKGTAQSVKDVVAAFGGAILLNEWWQQSPKGEPHTFDLLMTLSGAGGASATAAFVDDVIAEVNRTKPVRSHFTFTQGLNTFAAIAVVTALRPVIYARLHLTEAP